MIRETSANIYSYCDRSVLLVEYEWLCGVYSRSIPRPGMALDTAKRIRMASISFSYPIQFMKLQPNSSMS